MNRAQVKRVNNKNNSGYLTARGTNGMITLGEKDPEAMATVWRVTLFMEILCKIGRSIGVFIEKIC